MPARGWMLLARSAASLRSASPCRGTTDCLMWSGNTMQRRRGWCTTGAPPAAHHPAIQPQPHQQPAQAALLALGCTGRRSQTSGNSSDLTALRSEFQMCGSEVTDCQFWSLTGSLKFHAALLHYTHIATIPALPRPFRAWSVAHVLFTIILLYYFIKSWERAICFPGGSRIRCTCCTHPPS